MDHSTNTLTAAIKSLKDGVQPAVDSADPLATQQLALVLDYLGFLRSRLPYLHVRARIELRAAQDLAAVLQPHVGSVDAEAGRPLDDALAAALDLDDLAPVHTVEASTSRILAVLREVVRSARGAGPGGPARRRAGRPERERSDVLPLPGVVSAPGLRPLPGRCPSPG